MARRSSWFRTIGSVTSSAGYFGNAWMKAQQGRGKITASLVFSGMILSGSVLRLGAKITDNVGKRIGRNTSGIKNKKNTPKNQDRAFAKDEKESNKRLKNSKAVSGAPNYKPDSYFQPPMTETIKPEKVVDTKMTPEESKAMDSLTQFNSANAGRKGTDTDAKYDSIPDDFLELYKYFESLNPMISSMVYEEDYNRLRLNLKPLTNSDTQIYDYICVRPDAILNPDGENYFDYSERTPSGLMTKLLGDYFLETAPIMFIIVNYYYGHHSTTAKVPTSKPTVDLASLNWK